MSYYCTGVAALLYGRCSITASALQYHCNPGCSGWIASDGLNMKDRSSVGGQRKGDFIPVGDLLNLFYEFVRVYIRIFSIFIDRYLIFLVLIQELEVYIDTACLAVIDRTDKPILSLLRAIVTYSLTEAFGTTVWSQVVGTAFRNSNPGCPS